MIQLHTPHPPPAAVYAGRMPRQQAQHRSMTHWVLLLLVVLENLLANLLLLVLLLGVLLQTAHGVYEQRPGMQQGLVVPVDDGG